MKVFISGSIAIHGLPENAQIWIDSIIEAGHMIVVGDAFGIDRLVQIYLQDREYQHVEVYVTGTKVRNNLSGWPVKHVASDEMPGTREFYTAKDLQMARDADFGFMIWDGKSRGTFNNIKSMLVQGKSSAVAFKGDVISITTVEEFQQLEKQKD